MSEIGERAEKIWEKRYERIRQKKALRDEQAKQYVDVILDIFEISNEEDDEQYYISTVIVYYSEKTKYLYFCVQFNIEDSDKMKIVHTCEFKDCTMFVNIYDVLVADSQVTKYFEVTSNNDYEIVIKMRPEKDVKLDETICENEESEE